jgi:ATP-binding cassette subfamily B protein
LSREFRSLFDLLLQHKLPYAAGCFFLFCSDVFQLSVPTLVGWAIDGLKAGTLGAAGLTTFALGIVGAGLSTAIVRYLWRIFVFGTARRIDRDLRQRLYEHLQVLDAAWFATTKVGDLMAHATNDVQAVRAVAAEGVMAGWDALGMAVVTSAAMIVFVDWRLALVVLVPLFLLPPASYWMGERVHKRYEDVQSAFSAMSDRVQENVAGIRVVKGFAREADQVARFDVANEASRAAVARLARRSRARSKYG